MAQDPDSNTDRSVRGGKAAVAVASAKPGGDFLRVMVLALARQAAREAFAAAMTDPSATSVTGFAGSSSRPLPTETKPSTHRLESRHGA